MSPNNMNTGQARVIDPVLSTVAREYRPPGRVGEVLFPRVSVPARGGKIIEFGKEAFTLLNTRRAPGSQVLTVGFGYGNQDYQLHNDALDAHVPREVQADAMTVPGVDIGKRASKRVLDIMQLGLEFEQAELATNPDNYPAGSVASLSGSDLWDDAASHPGQIIEEAKERVRRTAGIEPNTMVLSKDAFRALRWHPKIMEQFKFTSSESITAGMLAAYFNLDKVAVGTAVGIQPDALEGADMTEAWSNCAVLAYVPPDPQGMEEPSFGFTYTLDNHPYVESPEWIGERRSWAYGVTFERRPYIVGMDAGFLFKGVVSVLGS